jgi:hypothetical protein
MPITVCCSPRLASGPAASHNRPSRRSYTCSSKYAHPLTQRRPARAPIDGSVVDTAVWRRRVSPGNPACWAITENYLLVYGHAVPGHYGCVTATLNDILGMQPAPPDLLQQLSGLLTDNLWFTRVWQVDRWRFLGKCFGSECTPCAPWRCVFLCSFRCFL